MNTPSAANRRKDIDAVKQEILGDTAATALLTKKMRAP